MTDLDDELNKLTSKLINPDTNLTFKMPVNVSASGKVLDDNEMPTIIGTFLPTTPLPNHPAGHQGIDLQAPKGTSIYAIAPGKVLWVTNATQNPKGGNSVKIQHNNNITSYYAHCDTVNVTAGQSVDQNTIIGTVGNSGNARFTSAHCHFEIKINNQNVNPLSVIGKPLDFNKKSELILNKLEKLANLFWQASIKL